MTFDITDYSYTEIYITDGWREWYIPKFRLTWLVDEPYITIYWTDTEKGRSGVTRTLEMDYQDVTFGYISPSSASEIGLQLQQYIDSAWDDITGGASWGSITGTLSDQTDLQAALDAKQDDLVSGTNIKTVNNTTLLGAGNLSTPQSTAVLYTSNNPASGGTRYFGNKPGAPSATGGQNKIYLRRAVTITGAEIYAYATATAGSNENISFYIRVNDTTDTLIQTVGVAAAERIFTNHGLSINLGTGDYFEIKRVNPSWGTPPTAEIAGGYILYQLQ